MTIVNIFTQTDNSKVILKTIDNFCPECIADYYTSGKVYDLDGLIDLSIRIKTMAAKRIKSVATNEKLNQILAATHNAQYIPTPITEREYCWSDARALGIMDKWDDIFFAEMEKISTIDYVLRTVFSVVDLNTPESAIRIEFGSDDEDV